MEVTTRKVTKSVAKLCNELIQKDILALKREKNSDIRKFNILHILNNVGSIFTGDYSHYKDVLKGTIFEKSITEKAKLRRQRFDEIKRKEQNINNKLFKVQNCSYFTDYQSPKQYVHKIKRDKRHRESGSSKFNQTGINKNEENSLKMHPKMMHLKLKRMKRYQILLKGFLSLIIKSNQDKD